MILVPRNRHPGAVSSSVPLSRCALARRTRPTAMPTRSGSSGRWRRNAW